MEMKDTVGKNAMKGMTSFRSGIEMSRKRVFKTHWKEVLKN
jgi:hypothetical protein